MAEHADAPNANKAFVPLGEYSYCYSTNKNIAY